MLKTAAQLGAAHGRSGDPALRQAGRVTGQSMRLREQLRPFASEKATSPVTYPKSDDASTRLRSLAMMLGAGLPIRCVALRAPGGYDTHSDQPKELADELKLTSDSLLAFQRTSRRAGSPIASSSMWTEFGGRTKENGSNGTDHGAAGVGFVLGTQTTGTMVGEFPGLTGGLDEDGNLKATADFRGVYAALSEQWLGVDADVIVPNAKSFTQPQLVK